MYVWKLRNLLFHIGIIYWNVFKYHYISFIVLILHFVYVVIWHTMSISCPWYEKHSVECFFVSYITSNFKSSNYTYNEVNYYEKLLIFAIVMIFFVGRNPPSFSSILINSHRFSAWDSSMWTYHKLKN